ETHIQVQKEIILSVRVLKSVVDHLHLEQDQPSNSFFSRLTGIGRRPSNKSMTPNEFLKAQERAIRNLRETITISPVNAETLSIQAKMNSPELAQKVTTEIISQYTQAYLSLLNEEVDAAKLVLSTRLNELDSGVRSRETSLIAFQEQHPDLILDKNEKGPPGEIFPPQVAMEVGNYSPVPELVRDQGKLEMELNKVLSVSPKSSFQAQRLQKELNDNSYLIDNYRTSLVNQAKLNLHHQELLWELTSQRTRFLHALDEADRVLIAQGVRTQQSSLISTLQSPTYEVRRVSPKVTVTLIASVFLGGILGVFLLYLATFMDNTYHLSIQLTRDLNIPVLARISAKEEKALRTKR
ncbi:MAG: hypothetical protein KDK40_05675, partial [Chlamydiia bacterium]|nr:hypothetical protein [Chlamydiia bacterium]